MDYVAVSASFTLAVVGMDLRVEERIEERIEERVAMSKPSRWPLNRLSRRIVAPVVIRQQLKNHVLAKDCYPLAIGFYEKASSHSMSRKKHDDHLLIYCFAGEGYLDTESWSGKVKAGEVVLLPAGVSHRYTADKENPWSVYWAHFSGVQAADYIAHMDYKETHPVVFVGHSPILISQFRAALNAASPAYNKVSLVYSANANKQILNYIAKLINDESSHKVSGIDLDMMQTLMLQNLDKALSLDWMAKQANLSKYHFSKKYKQQTGYSPIQHFLKMKVEYARYLLETSDSTVQEIADKVGYDDALYFSRLFKKEEGVAPQTYRLSKC